MQASTALMIVLFATILDICAAPHGLFNTAHFVGESSPASAATMSSGSACAISACLVVGTAAMTVELLKRGNAAKTLMTEAVR